MREKARADLQDIWMAETKKEASAAFDLFVETCGVKYERAVAKLAKDRDVLPTFYDSPAEHWKHIRTTNPIESVFATARNRTRKTRGCLNRKTALAMVFRHFFLADDVRPEEVAEDLGARPSARAHPRG
jgi:transposase-like protein